MLMPPANQYHKTAGAQNEGNIAQHISGTDLMCCCTELFCVILCRTLLFLFCSSSSLCYFLKHRPTLNTKAPWQNTTTLYQPILLSPVLTTHTNLHAQDTAPWVHVPASAVLPISSVKVRWKKEINMQPHTNDKTTKMQTKHTTTQPQQHRVATKMAQIYVQPWQRQQQKIQLSAVGLEPTSANTLRPERNPLDRSGKPTMKDVYSRQASSAPSGNRTRVTSMATRYYTTKPMVRWKEVMCSSAHSTIYPTRHNPDCDCCKTTIEIYQKLVLTVALSLIVLSTTMRFELTRAEPINLAG